MKLVSDWLIKLRMFRQSHPILFLIDLKIGLTLNLTSHWFKNRTHAQSYFSLALPKLMFLHNWILKLETFKKEGLY